MGITSTRIASAPATRAVRALIVSTVHPPFDVRIFVKEAATLARAGVDVSVAMTVERSSVVEDMHILPLGKYGGTKWKRIGRNLRALRLMMGRYDVVHVHDPELLVSAALAHLMGRRVIYDVHEFYHRKLGGGDTTASWIPRPLRFLAARAYALLEEALLPRIAGVVVVTPEMAQEYRPLVREARLVLVRNLPSIAASDVARLRATNRPLEQPYIVHTGGASRSRCFETLLDAAEYLRERGETAPIVNIGAIVLGDYDAAERARLIQRARRLDVRLLGRLPYDEVLRWLAHASIGYLPLEDSGNHAAAYATKLFEYFAFGLPIVASDVGLSAGLVRSHGAGIVVKNDGVQTGGAFEALLRDESRRSALGDASFAAAADYSFANDGERLVELYRQIGAAR